MFEDKLNRLVTLFMDWNVRFTSL